MLNARRALDFNLIKQPLRIALYARHSSKNQNPLSTKEQQGRSEKKFRSRQVQFLKYTSDKYDYDTVTFIYFSDEAKSGTKTGRDGYDDFKKCIENGGCDVAIVDDLSRIVRDLGEQMDFFYLLKFTGVELFSVCDQISSESPTSKVNFQIKGLVNEMERENIGLKTRRGLEARADKGLSCGDICFGYISVATETRNRGGLIIPSHFKPEIELEQAKTVNFIYDEYLKGVGLSAVAKQLNKNLVPSPTRGQKITGKKYNWNCSTIRKILTNPKYIGQWDWGRTKSLFNPITDKKVKRDVPKDQWVSRAYREDLVIISKEKWDKVQKRFDTAAVKYKQATDKTKAMRDLKKPGSGGQALLSGVLRCGHCGQNMLQITKNYYGCYTHHRKSPTLCSNHRMVNCKKIEGKVIQVISDTLLNPSVLESATKTLNDKIKARLRVAPDELKILERKLVEAERELQNLLKFIMSHGDSSPTIKGSLTEKEAEVSFYKQQILTLKTANVDRLLVTPFALRARFQKLADLFASDPVLANAALRKLIPNGLSCLSAATTAKKNLNQNNSKWRVTGELVIGHSNQFESDSAALIKPNLVELCFDLKREGSQQHYDFRE